VQDEDFHEYEDEFGEDDLQEVMSEQIFASWNNPKLNHPLIPLLQPHTDIPPLGEYLPQAILSSEEPQNESIREFSESFHPDSLLDLNEASYGNNPKQINKAPSQSYMKEAQGLASSHLDPISHSNPSNLRDLRDLEAQN
jgi:hypothetical protein